jgi:hypothetical protein
VLKPGGEFHLLDFGPPQGGLATLVTALTRHLEETSDNFAGRLPAFMVEAGFSDVRDARAIQSPFGTLHFYRARRAGP